MNSSTGMSTVALIALLITAVGGGAGLTPLARMILGWRRDRAQAHAEAARTTAETGKAGADAEAAMATAAQQIAGAAASMVGTLLGPAQQRIEALEGEVNRLKARVGELTAELDAERRARGTA